MSKSQEMIIAVKRKVMKILQQRIAQIEVKTLFLTRSHKCTWLQNWTVFEMSHTEEKQQYTILSEIISHNLNVYTD